MADNKIVHRISLEGDAEINRKFDAVGEHGKKAFKDIKDAADGSKIGDHFATVEGNADSGRQGVERFREAVHVLHPVLDTAGLGLSNLGAFARAAGTGLAGLLVAIVGSVVVGLAKLADQAATTKKQLDDLSPGQGASHFAGLREDAKRLGTDVDNLIPAYKQVLGLRNDLNASTRNELHAPGHEPFNLPGGPLSNENLRAATSGVQSLFAAGKAEDPGKAAADFFSALRKSGGKLTPEALQGAAGASEGAANKIAQSLPEGFTSYQQAIAALNSGRVIDKDELFRSLAKAAPEAEKTAQSVRGLKEAFDGAGSSFKELVKDFSGDSLSGGLTRQIDAASQGMRTLADDIERLKHPEEFKPGGAKFIGPVRPGIDDRGEPAPTPDLLGRAASFVRGGGQGLNGGNPLGEIATFIKEALTNPGGFSERHRPESGPSSLAPNAAPAATAVEQLAPTIQTGDATITDAVKSGTESTNAILGNILGALINAISKPTPSATEPQSALGVRGAKGLLLAGGGRLDATGGGHIEGPGTPTSDSIPLWGSRKEYMVNAEAVESVGVPFMHRLNQLGRKALGMFGLGAGGPVGGSILAAGNHSISYDPNTGGAVIDGVIHRPGDPILDDPVVAAAIARSKAGMNETSGRHRSAFSDSGDFKASGDFGDFTKPFGGGNFATGGLVGDSPVDRFRSRLGAMGFRDGGVIDVSHLVPHMASGGIPDLPSLDSLSPPSSGSGIDLSHYGTLDLMTDRGSMRVITHEDTLRHMSAAAADAATFSTGKKPSWYGGGR